MFLLFPGTAYGTAKTVTVFFISYYLMKLIVTYNHSMVNVYGVLGMLVFGIFSFHKSSIVTL